MSVPPHLSFHRVPFFANLIHHQAEHVSTKRDGRRREEKGGEAGGGLIIQMFTVAFKDKLIKACTRTRANIRDGLEIMRVHTQHARADVSYNMRV